MRTRNIKNQRKESKDIPKKDYILNEEESKNINSIKNTNNINKKKINEIIDIFKDRNKREKGIDNKKISFICNNKIANKGEINNINSGKRLRLNNANRITFHELI